MASIRTLKTFLAVARQGSFAGAADEVGLTPAAVGLRMRALEDDLRQLLFDRTGHSVVVNAFGLRTVPRIAELVSRYDDLVDWGEGGPLSGTISMGALVSALMGSFADALWCVKQKNPRLEVKLFAGQSSDFAAKVEQGLLDAAIITCPPYAVSRETIWSPLYAEPMILIVPRRPHFSLPKQPLQILRTAPFIRFDRDTWTGLLVQEVLSRVEVRARDEMELNSVEAILEIVRQGFGVSIVPKLANVDWPSDRQLRVVSLPHVTVQRRVGLLERPRHRRVQFTEEIKTYFGNVGMDRP